MPLVSRGSEGTLEALSFASLWFCHENFRKIRVYLSLHRKNTSTIRLHAIMMRERIKRAKSADGQRRTPGQNVITAWTTNKSCVVLFP
jgi:hypothetical protein